MYNMKTMWTFPMTVGLVHNLVPIIPNYNLYNPQNIEDNIDYVGL